MKTKFKMNDFSKEYSNVYFTKVEKLERKRFEKKVPQFIYMDELKLELFNIDRDRITPAYYYRDKVSFTGDNTIVYFW